MGFAAEGGGRKNVLGCPKGGGGERKNVLGCPKGGEECGYVCLKV